MKKRKISCNKYINNSHRNKKYIQRDWKTLFKDNKTLKRKNKKKYKKWKKMLNWKNKKN
jgi:hypothetical protein